MAKLFLPVELQGSVIGSHLFRLSALLTSVCSFFPALAYSHCYFFYMLERLVLMRRFTLVVLAVFVSFAFAEEPLVTVLDNGLTV